MEDKVRADKSKEKNIYFDPQWKQQTINIIEQLRRRCMELTPDVPHPNPLLERKHRKEKQKVIGQIKEESFDEEIQQMEKSIRQM